MPDRKLDVRVYPIDKPKGDTKALASVSIDGVVAIRGIRVVESRKGLLVSMPQSQDRNKKFHDIAFPLSRDLRKQINRAVRGEYKEQINLPPDQRGYTASDIEAAKNVEMGEVKLNIQVYPLQDPDGSTKAFASIAIGDLAAIRGLRVVDGEKGLFVTMPQSEDRQGLFRDVAFPLSGDLRKEINKGVLEKFEVAKSVDHGQSLGDRLAAGKERAAEHIAPQQSAAKTQHPGVLE